ncbi:PQQ-binding-like beta-propeller repeat protein [Aquabacterium sp.]|uniref:PQQ-binding-like beta-propeller repeat protein n=1 Tax=Aquabacterium sp. TaxID=1872578 RepID=UPI002E30944E|nr:PQQ-binding-like beta-propeller repeat protein [Aquabacterium sp.]HEX5312603.1 PQQ-binding-like beta-propeller repeat protein [Aquabacterium sp.]
MQQTRVQSPGSPVRLTRFFGLALGVGLLVTLGACGSSKPKPAPLESLQPTRTVSVVWSQGLGSVEGAAGLTFTGDTVVAAAAGGDIVALDVKTGARQWELDVRSRLATAAGSDGRFTAVVTTGNELVVFEKGKEVWRERQPGRVATAPFVAGERVFIQAVDRSVRAYDAADGRWLWNYQRAGGESLSLAVPGVVTNYRDTLLVGQGARLIALDPVKGTPRFEANLGTPRGSNEVERLADLVGPSTQVDGDVCVRAFQLTVGCVNASNGAVRWTRPQAGARAIAANADVVVGADSADRVSAWKASNGDILWRVDRFTHRGLSGMAIWGDLLAVADSDGYLHLLALDDGRTVGRFSLDAPLEIAPTVKNGLLFAQTRRGTVYALRSN